MEKKSKPFSLVPTEAQQQMYRAIEAALRTASDGSGSRASTRAVAEIAASAALGQANVVLLPADSAAAAFVTNRYGKPERTRKPAAQLPDAPGYLTYSTHQDPPTDPLTAATYAAFARLASNAVSRLALISCGELTDESRLRETLRIAARMRLPILYLVHNDIGSRKPKTDLRSIYAELGVPVITVDQADAIAIYRVATEAMHNARVGRGPTLIEAISLPAPKGKTSTEPLAALESYMRRHETWFDQE